LVATLVTLGTALGHGPASLIKIKAGADAGAMMVLFNRSTSMPIETTIVVAAIVIAFAIFAGTLAWASHVRA
jgi:multisubunit Na+/H+ antiporter MnhC subunit